MVAETPTKSPPIVLIVEDEPLQRMLAVEIVEKAGFVALEAGNADEAVALLQSRADISLLFTDIDMPGSMDGLKLAHAVRDRWPPTRTRSPIPSDSSVSTWRTSSFSTTSPSCRRCTTRTSA